MFGAEGPIQDKTLAESRAAVCCAPCPENQAGDWLSFFTVPVSAALRAALSALKHQGLETSRDEGLHVCRACSCPMKLKVWARLPHILKHIPAESKSKLWQQCWVLKEEREAKNNG
jgi:hypothetical protein